MVICFDASTEAKRALDALLESQQFRDTSETISAALVNYETICRVLAKEGQAGIDSLFRSKRVVAAPSDYTASSIDVGKPRSSTTPKPKPRLPEIFALQTGEAHDLTFAPVTELRNNTYDLPPTHWLFGQYNKFLPVKATCRALLNLLQQRTAGIPLHGAVETISNAAWELGDYLYTLDLRSSRPREDLFASAFPTSASSGAVSRIRFANQFVGDLRQSKQGENPPKDPRFTGFPAALKFITCSDGKEPLLQLTTYGAEFATFRNPAFDGDVDAATTKFSDTEIEFLLAHIPRYVPEETSAYISIIDAISENDNTPQKLDENLCRKFGLQRVTKVEAKNQIAETFLTTQRTGAISRMTDLGLIARAKTGLRVIYNLTETGKSFQRLIG